MTERSQADALGNVDLAWAASFNSMEGVPDWPPLESDAAPGLAPWQRHANAVFAWIGLIAPGLVLAAVVAAAGGAVARWIGLDLLGFKKSPVSGIMVAILLGMILRNLLGLPEVYERGLRLCLKRILRIGIALLGIRLSLGAAGAIGLAGLPVVLVCIVSALVLVSWLGKWLRLPARLGSLIAVGTSICGATAIVATGGVINAEDDEISYAVACITIFGVLAMFGYPLLAHWIFAGDPTPVGLFLGTAIHETAQVAGAGLMYEQQFGAPEALSSAVVTKLVRNLCMVWVIPMMAILYRRSDNSTGTTVPWYRLVPLFVVGFLAMSLLRTVGDLGNRPFGLIDTAVWQEAVTTTKEAAEWCLMVAMAAVGLGTSVERLRHLGWRPFTAGLAAAALVGVVGVAMIHAVAPML